RAVVEAEGDVDGEHVEAEEAEHRPGAERQEQHAGGEADGAERDHQREEAFRSERAVGCEHRTKGLTGVFWPGLRLLGISVHLTILSVLTVCASLPNAAMPKPSRLPARLPKAVVAARPRPIRARRKPGPAPERVEEIFRRFAAANPEPKGELEHLDPFTLLV